MFRSLLFLIATVSSAQAAPEKTLTVMICTGPSTRPATGQTLEDALQRIFAEGVEPSADETEATEESTGTDPSVQSWDPIGGPLHAVKPLVFGCYEASLAEQPELAGRHEVTMMVEGGVVKSVDLTLDSLGVPDAAACVVSVLRSVTFPANTKCAIHTEFVYEPEQ